MPATEPGKIRNIAVVGHRGVGKTSLVEALLFQAGKINRLRNRESRHDGLGLGRRRAGARDVALRLAAASRLARPQINLIDCPATPAPGPGTFAALESSRERSSC
jgi:elongation factor G